MRSIVAKNNGRVRRVTSEVDLSVSLDIGCLNCCYWVVCVQLVFADMIVVFITESLGEKLVGALRRVAACA